MALKHLIIELLQICPAIESHTSSESPRSIEESYAVKT